MAKLDNLELIEERISKLERLVGSFKEQEQTQFLSIVKDISSKLNSVLHENPKIATHIKTLNDLKKYENFDVFSEIDDENMIKAKAELIISEEENIRKLDKDFENLKALSKILDNPVLNDTPKWLEKLKDISAKQAEIKVKSEEFDNEIKSFLAVYFETMKSIDKSMENLNGYIDDTA